MALEIKRETLGERNFSTASTLKHIGDVYWKHCRKDEALETYQLAIGIREALGDHHAIGVEYFHQCKYDLALESLTLAPDYERKVFGEQHPSTKDTLDWIGATREQMAAAGAR